MMLFQTWFSLYVGWGCYFSFGGPPTNPCGRVAFADWILGRQDEHGWEWGRRIVLNYAGMGLRGLLRASYDTVVIELDITEAFV